MSIRRIKDPAGLKPDRVLVELSEENPGPVNVWEAFESLTPNARAQALRQHPELAERADKISARLEAADGHADDRTMWMLAEAEAAALYLKAAPQVLRDQARQAGTRKPREPVEGLQAWIDKQVTAESGETARQLWDRAPDWITDAIGFDRFVKRVSDARKRLGIARKGGASGRT